MVQGDKLCLYDVLLTWCDDDDEGEDRWPQNTLEEVVGVLELISQWDANAAGDYGQAEMQLISRGGRIIAFSERGNTQWKQGTRCINSSSHR